MIVYFFFLPLLDRRGLDRRGYEGINLGGRERERERETETERQRDNDREGNISINFFLSLRALIKSENASALQTLIVLHNIINGQTLCGLNGRSLFLPLQSIFTITIFKDTAYCIYMHIHMNEIGEYDRDSILGRGIYPISC